MTNIFTSTVDAEIANVGAAWVQNNQADFPFFSLPSARTNPLADGYSGTVNYDLPKLEKFLQAGLLVDWKPGNPLPQDDKWDYTGVSATVTSRATKPETRNLRSRVPRYSDLEGRIVPGMMGRMYSGVLKEMVNFLTNTSNFGTARLFVGTDPLGDLDSDGSQAPLNDIENDLNDIRIYEDGRQFQIECIMSIDTLDILRRKTDYHGAGAGSAVASALPVEQFLQTFMAIHRISKVHLIRTAVNRSGPGATASIGRPKENDASTGGGGILWFGVMDRRASEFDMRYGSTPDFSPDGALVFWRGDDFLVTNEVHTNQRIERFHGTVEFGFSSPRGSTFGFFYDPAEILPT